VQLNFSYDMSVDCAYIIIVPGLKTSEDMAQRCLMSCEDVGQKAVLWTGYNGVPDEIQEPPNSSPIMDCIKLTDHFLTRGGVACALSHISLWAKCVTDDKPLIILEHDAIMVAPYLKHAVFNSICYLGGIEQQEQGWSIGPTPPHGSDGPNYHFICRAHAYAIDPAVAKNMLAYVIKYGINTSNDRLLRADIFPIHQTGLFAYDRGGDTTIINRPPTLDRNSMRNEGLKLR